MSFTFIVFEITSNVHKLILLLVIIGLILPQVVLFGQWKNAYRIDNYEALLQNLTLSKNIELLSFDEYITRKATPIETTIVIMRHDVDISLRRAKNMIKLDKKYGVPSTYFFRNRCEKYKFEDIIPILEDLSNQDKLKVGFHYSTLSNSMGDLGKAKSEFIKELEIFNDYIPIKFIAAHGDRYRNRQLVTENVINLEELNLFSAYDIGHDIYLSEAGGLHHFTKSEGKITFRDQVKILDEPTKGRLIQILIHPDWWF